MPLSRHLLPLFALSALASCRATSTEASAARAIAPVAPVTLPPTSKDGTPYVFRNVAIGGGGFVTGIAYSPAKAGVVYARTDVGGAYRLDPLRSRWVPLTDSFGRADANLTGVESVAPDPVDPNRVYFAVGAYAQSWASNGAILRSSDQGATFQRTEMPIRMGANESGRSLGERLAVDPNKTDHLWLGSRKNGLWRSIDAGVTWNRVASFPARDDSAGIGISFVVFDTASGARGKPTPTFYVGVAGSSPGLYRTTDAGASFSALAKQPPKLLPGHAAFDAHRTLYISYVNAPGPSDITAGAVFKYEPLRDAFSDVSPKVPSESDRFGYGGLAVDIQHPGTLLVTTIDRWVHGDEIFRSTDGGAHWSPLLERARRDARGANYLYFGRIKLGPPAWMGDIDIDPFDANRVMLASGHGIWASDDIGNADKDKPVHFAFQNDGLEETVVSAIASPSRGAELLSGLADICGFRHDDIGTSPRRGMHANPICNTTSSLDYAALEPEIVVRSGTLWGKGKHGAISNDGGQTFAPFASEPEGAETGGMLVISADGKSLLWALSGRVPAYSRDQSKSWREVNGLPTPEGPLASFSLRLASDRVNPQKAYAFDSALGVTYFSDDGGAHFERGKSSLPELRGWARSSASIQAMPGVEGEVWITTGKALFRSVDSGRSYTALEGVEESHALGFGKGASAYSSLFLVGKVSAVYGFFRSDDLGNSFVRVNDDEHQFGLVSHITGDPRRFGRVYLGTGGRGILVGDPR
jgi:hypothetical protein